MKDVEFTTSTSRMFAIVGIMSLLSAIALTLGHADGNDVFRGMAGVISTLALVMFTQVK